MSGINKVHLIGRLGKEVSMRYTQDGTAIANFSIATSEEWKDRATGEKKERTEWHRIVAFKRLGEICGEYLSRGSQVYIEGRLQTRSWEKDGVTRYSTEIVASDVQFLGGRQEQKQEPKKQETTQPEERKAYGSGDEDNDNIPF